MLSREKNPSFLRLYFHEELLRKAAYEIDHFSLQKKHTSIKSIQDVETTVFLTGSSKVVDAFGHLSMLCSASFKVTSAMQVEFAD